ncbi:hypothetical protein KFZ56_04830 [Virgibacillus sp. NKC19-3]|uniref:hypothetical protein n=1 Tax=Virgibacillus saliphilus TaxID=2831674 RepID=UPI001C9A4768|nr:hypothetical protein [Virgibacillus sp. NKC19-3]MBY7142414.1 hypothetical protein [Virgibacillus sp. NKC19-3]
MYKTLLSAALVIVLSVVVFGSTSFASEVGVEDDVTPQKVFGPYKFKTGDGQWDGQLTVPFGGGDVTVTVEDLKDNTFVPFVRLCNASSGKCTPLEPLQSDNTRTFTNMLRGTYYGDVETGTVSTTGVIRFDVR